MILLYSTNSKNSFRFSGNKSSEAVAVDVEVMAESEVLNTDSAPKQEKPKLWKRTLNFFGNSKGDRSKDEENIQKRNETVGKAINNLKGFVGDKFNSVKNFCRSVGSKSSRTETLKNPKSRSREAMSKGLKVARKGLTSAKDKLANVNLKAKSADAIQWLRDNLESFKEDFEDMTGPQKTAMVLAIATATGISAAFLTPTILGATVGTGFLGTGGMIGTYGALAKVGIDTTAVGILGMQGMAGVKTAVGVAGLVSAGVGAWGVNSLRNKFGDDNYYGDEIPEGATFSEVEQTGDSLNGQIGDSQNLANDQQS